MRKFYLLIVFVVISIVAVGVALVVYNNLNTFPEIDKSWIGDVETFLEVKKPYPEYDEREHGMYFAKVWLYENGEEHFVGGTNSKGLLEGILKKANMEVEISLDKDRLNEILDNDRFVELDYRLYEDFHIWNRFINALFIMEDDMNQGLEGCFIIKQTLEDGGYQWSCWVCKE